MNEEKPAIEVRNISKTFKIPLDGGRSLKQRIVHFLKRTKGYREFSPLDGVTFTVNKGDFYGIVGRNGSGKSTLLKTIAGIYVPDKGMVKIHGKLVPFIELGVGFNPELTGRENVYLNGALLGFSRKEIAAMYEEIVDFAELHDFMEEQLKNYSSGMQVRLAFSIAIRAKGDILLLDEVLAVGDSAFQQKCFDYFEKLKRERRTIILVTHGMDSVKRFCNKALLLESGKIKLIGSPEEVADQYTVDNMKSKASQTSEGGGVETSLSDTVSSLKLKRKSPQKIKKSDTLDFDISYELEKEFSPSLAFTISKGGVSIAEMNSLEQELPSDIKMKHVVSFSAPLESFNPGLYRIDIAILDRENWSLQAHSSKVAEFVVEGNDKTRGGAIYLNGQWSLKDE